MTLTSVVKRKYDAGVPTGWVTFSVGGHNLGTQALDGTGTAAGTYPVTATYSGDAGNAASSATVDVKVEWATRVDAADEFKPNDNGKGALPLSKIAFGAGESRK